MSKQTTKITSDNAKVGDTYTRNRFEVHYLGSDNKTWFAMARNAKTLQEARAQLADRKAGDRALAGFIQLGKFPRTRIVKVLAEVTVVEILE